MAQTQVKYSPKMDPIVFAFPITGISFYGDIEVKRDGKLLTPFGPIGRMIKRTEKYPAVAVIRAHKPLSKRGEWRPWSWTIIDRSAKVNGIGEALVRLEILPPKREILSPDKLPVLEFYYERSKRIGNAGCLECTEHISIEGNVRELLTLTKCSFTKKNCTRIIVVLRYGKARVTRKRKGWRMRGDRFEEEEKTEVGQ